MKTLLRLLCAVMPVAGLFAPNAFAASTPGGAHLTATINDLTVRSGSTHYVVVWVTKADNTFITTLWKQGATSFTGTHWTQHFPTWETQRGSSTALPAPPDGYSSATATSYAATDPSPPTTGRASNPINLTWNGKDASGVVVPDGDYRFWIEYAEDTGTHGTDTGGLTTGGLTFKKGPTSSTINSPNQGAVGNPSGGFNFTSMSIVWTPAAVTTPPTITSGAPTATGTVGTAYSFQVTASGNPAPTFSATGLPTGLSISTNGLISGIPSAAGTFSSVAIAAANGVAPNATQAYTITINPAALVNIGSARIEGSNLVLSGTGPAHATYDVLSSPDVSLPTAQWTKAGTGTIDSNGNFSTTVPVGTGVPQSFTKLRVPAQ